jgi:hypothetical protein
MSTTLTQYGRLAEKHWREFRPRMVAEMEATRTLQTALMEAEETTVEEMAALIPKLQRQFDLTHQQAHDQAWEMTREKYLLLPPEDEI